ncbi:Uncharacterized protein dnm_019610 [Desulfonema magnum]|uniref:Uncharacterized protein n=1 Tax=Desulfonema magnum TaxID=45655 RepID=A0A975BIW2_9BACT|nr:Uncharacterized protein dnm_019610 [Desulfonema magnum]
MFFGQFEKLSRMILIRPFFPNCTPRNLFGRAAVLQRQ